MKKIILFFILLWSVNSRAQGWQNCGDGVRGKPTYATWCAVSSMAADTVNNILYVAGNFDTINGTTPVHGIATWNGLNWKSIPILENNWPLFYSDSSNEYINALIFYHDALFFPCSFTYDYNGQLFTVYYVGKYNGDSLQLLPYLDGPVDCFTVFNDTLYIGGQFYESDTTVLDEVAKWDGTNWQPMGSGFTGYAAPEVLALSISNGNLYAGGFFDQSGNTTHLLSIAQWKDTAWTPLGRGIADPVDSSREGFVNAIGTFQNNLYVGGDFGFAGGDSANNIAEWNGAKWFNIGDSAGGLIQTFQAYKNKLYIGGAGGIIGWDGIHYSNIGHVNSFVYSLVTFQNSLYVGGAFDSTGNIVANAIARWSPDSTSSIKQISKPGIQLNIYPNPFSESTTIKLDVGNRQHWQFILQDLLGRTVAQYNNEGKVATTIQHNNLPAGLYIGIAKDDEGQMMDKTKVVVQ